MIDTTSIGYAIFYAYGFIQDDRFAEWRANPSIEDPTKTNEQYTIAQTEEKIAKGREEAVKRGIAPLYDEWIETERAYFARCQEGHAFDDEVLALQRKRLSLAEKVKLRSMGIGE